MSVSTLRIAWRNLGRNRRRSILAAGAIALGQLAFLAVAGLMRGYSVDFLNSATGPLVGHAQVHAPGWREDRSMDLLLENLSDVLSDIRSDPEVEHAAPRIYAPALAALSEEGFMSVLVGIEPLAESHNSGLLPGGALAGRIGEGRVLVGRALARKYEIEPGMEIAIVGQDVDGSVANDLFTVAGVISSPVEVVNNVGVVMSLSDAQELLAMPGQAHEIVIHVSDKDRLDATVARLSAMQTLKSYEVLPWQEIVPHVESMIEMIEVFSLIILFIVCIAAIAGIANTMLMSTFERAPEFGMLLSLGCGPGRLARFVVVEAILLSLLGVGVGTALGLGFVMVTGETGLDYAALGGRGDSYEVAFRGLQLSSVVYPRISTRDVAVGVAAVLLTSLLSVLWPVAHVVRLEPIEAMRS